MVRAVTDAGHRSLCNSSILCKEHVSDLIQILTANHGIDFFFFFNYRMYKYSAESILRMSCFQCTRQVATGEGVAREGELIKITRENVRLDFNTEGKKEGDMLKPII
jgi:hypothetical protein